jgi:hypothetical protein
MSPPCGGVIANLKPMNSLLYYDLYGSNNIMIPLSRPSSSIGLLFMSLLCSPTLDLIYIIKFCILTRTGISMFSYGFFHMHGDSCHTFDSDDELDYYDKSLDELKRRYIKVYRQGYLRPCDPRNEDSSNTRVLKNDEHIATDNNKRLNG